MAFRSVAGLLTLVAGVCVAGCAGAPKADDVSSREGGCLPGMTALAPRTLAAGGFTGLGLEDGAVFATGTAQLQRLPLSGDPASTLATMDGAYGLVVAGTTAYFVGSPLVGAPDAQGKRSSSPALFSVPLAGGVPTLVLDAYFDLSSSATDGEAIYLAAPAGGVTRLSLADGTRTDLALPATLAVNALAVHAGAVYLAVQDFGSQSSSNGAIVKLPTTGGAPRTLVANIGHPWTLVADASGLFWVEDPPVGDFNHSSRVVRADLDGSNARTLLDHPARSLVVDEGMLYVAWDGISKVPVGGGAEVPLVSGLNAPGLLAVSHGNAAWVDPVSQARSDPTVPALVTTCW